MPTLFCYGLTPAETALFLRDALQLSTLDFGWPPPEPLLQTNVATDIPQWRATSPAIVTLENALCFPVTVFLEALPLLDHARGTPLAFQRIGSAHADISQLALPPLPGLRVTPTEYPDKTGRTLPGLAVAVTDPAQFRPAAAAPPLSTALERPLGDTRGNHPGAPPPGYTQLWGTPTPPPWPLFSTPTCFTNFSADYPQTRPDAIKPHFAGKFQLSNG